MNSLISHQYELFFDVTSWSPLNDCSVVRNSHTSKTATDAPFSLQLAPRIERLPLDADHDVWFVPSQSQVAVLNKAAAGLIYARIGLQSWADVTLQEQEMIAHCYQLGLLVDSDIGHAQRPMTASDVLSAWLHVTNACNLRCSYCYIEKSDAAMSAETGRAAIDAILRSAQLHGYRRVQLKYAGGEAGLSLPQVFELHSYAREQTAALGIDLSGGVLSNGTVLNPARLRAIREHGLELTISLDGLGATHDQQRPTLRGRPSSQTTMRAIDRAIAEGIDLVVAITVGPSSVDSLPDTLRWLLAREVRFCLSFSRDTQTEASGLYRSDEERLIAGMRAAYAVIAEQPPTFSLLGNLLDRSNLGIAHERACGAGDSYIVVGHDGQIAKCQMELAHPISSVKTFDPLNVIRLDVHGLHNVPIDQRKGCDSCEWRYWCAGGCPIETFHATGVYDERSPYCAVYRTLFPEVLRLEGLRLLKHKLSHI